ncbi:MAG: hypothetical protein Rubg2KO_31620 [Rubricoccaceae bacterium]
MEGSPLRPSNPRQIYVSMGTQNGLRLLLVDDDEVDRAGVRRRLRPKHDVCEATTAADARARLDDAEADLVLLDYRLPDVDGTELIPWFTERGLPVIMLTGVDDAEAAVDAMRGGASDYLIKGHLDADTLERAIQKTWETATLRRAVAEQQGQLAEQATALEAQNQEIRELATALTLAEQAERSRVATLLHNDIQQLLFGAQLTVQSLLSTSSADLPEAIEQAHHAIDLCLQATRKLTLDLTPPVLDDEDYSVALQWLASHIRETYGLQVEVTTHGTRPTIRQREVRVLVTELVRELLFNTVKHAETDRALVRLSIEETGEMVVEVEDEGRGFEPSKVIGSGGFGLNSIRGRIGLVGGQFDLDSRPGAGTRARLRIPTGEA